MSTTDQTARLVHLQAIGKVPGVPLKEIRPGDVLMWNYGSTSTVVAAHQITATMWQLVTETADGKQWTQRKRGTTLVCRSV